MERYPVLGWIVRFGTAGTVVLALLVAALAIVSGYASLGWIAVVAGVVGAGVVYVLGRSYVEIVTILTEMLVPR